MLMLWANRSNELIAVLCRWMIYMKNVRYLWRNFTVKMFPNIGNHSLPIPAMTWEPIFVLKRPTVVLSHRNVFKGMISLAIQVTCSTARGHNKHVTCVTWRHVRCQTAEVTWSGAPAYLPVALLFSPISGYLFTRVMSLALKLTCFSSYPIVSNFLWFFFQLFFEEAMYDREEAITRSAFHFHLTFWCSMTLQSTNGLYLFRLKQ